jgi:predicted nucleic acid-binding protein
LKSFLLRESPLTIKIADGLGKTFIQTGSTEMAGLVDTNILVYRVDRRSPEKRARATDFLRRGLERNEIRIAHQAIAEFVAAVTRVRGRGQSILSMQEALLQAEALLDIFPVLYPTEGLLRLAFRGMATYQLSWFDAHMWAYAEFYSLSPLYTEDLEPGLRIGTVDIENPLM